MGKLLIWICIIIIAIPIVRYLLSFLREYVKLILSDPKEIFYRLEDSFKRSLSSIKRNYVVFINSFSKLNKAYKSFLDKCSKLYDKIRRRVNPRISDDKKPDDEGEILEDKEGFRFFRKPDQEVTLNIEPVLDDDKAKELARLNVHIPIGIFKKLELGYIPARLYKLCHRMDGLKATKWYLKKINYPIDIIINSNDQRNKLIQVLDCIMDMERYVLLSNLTDEPFYELLEQRGVEIYEIKEKLEQYRKLSEIYNMINTDEIIFHQYEKKFKPQANRKLKRWGSLSSKGINSIYSKFQYFYKAHLNFAELRDDILTWLDALEAIEGSLHLKELERLKRKFSEEIDDIKNGNIGIDEFEKVLTERLNIIAEVYDEFYEPNDSDSSKDDDSGSDWRKSTDDGKKEPSRKIDENDLKNLGLPADTTSWEVIRKAFKKLAIKWHPDKHATESEEIQEEAKRMFQKVNLSYERLEKDRKKYPSKYTK